jgi:hypothetical protein
MAKITRTAVTSTMQPGAEGRELMRCFKAYAEADHAACRANRDGLTPAEKKARNRIKQPCEAILSRAYGQRMGLGDETHWTGGFNEDRDSWPVPAGQANVTDLALIAFGLHVDGCEPNNVQALASHCLELAVLEVAGIPKYQVSFHALYRAAERSHTPIAA